MSAPQDEHISSLSTRLVAALELMEFGILLMRQNIKRSLPSAPETHVDAELRRWLIDQPPRFKANPPPAIGS
jgi:hypothetical protein